MSGRRYGAAGVRRQARAGSRVIDAVGAAAGDSLAIRFRGDQWTEGATEGNVQGCIDMVSGGSITQGSSSLQMTHVLHNGKEAFKCDTQGGTVACYAQGAITEFAPAGSAVVYLAAFEAESLPGGGTLGRFGTFGNRMIADFIASSPTAYPYTYIATGAGNVQVSLTGSLVPLDAPQLLHAEVQAELGRLGLNAASQDTVTTTLGGLSLANATIGATNAALDQILYIWEVVGLLNPTAAQTAATRAALASKYGAAA